MKNKEWSVGKAAVLGLMAGPPLVATRGLIEGTAPSAAAEWIGLLVGGAVGGMFMFALIAAVRNLWAR